MASKSTNDLLELSDVGCNICLEILTEPITMPCNHRMCRSCFEKNIELTNLLCPFCKRRIGTWCRKAKKVESLVDQKLWRKIQDQFPAIVEARLAGISDEGTSGLFEVSWSHNICASGEIGQEFEAQMDEIRREDEERARVEAEQSEKLIAEMMKNEPELNPRPMRPQDTDDAESKKLIRELLKEENKSNSIAPKKVETPNRKPGASRQSFDWRNFLKRSASESSPAGKENSNFPARGFTVTSPEGTKMLSPARRSSQSSGDERSPRRTPTGSSTSTTTTSMLKPAMPLSSPLSSPKRLTAPGVANSELGLEITPELLELQMRLEASIAQQKADEELARRLQQQEQDVQEVRSPTNKRLRSVGPRQATLEETLTSSKRRRLE